MVKSCIDQHNEAGRSVLKAIAKGTKAMLSYLALAHTKHANDGSSKYTFAFLPSS